MDDRRARADEKRVISAVPGIDTTGISPQLFLSQMSLRYSALVSSPNVSARTAARAQVFAALGDPVRLAIVDDLVATDRSPAELQERFDVPSNLLTHHLDVLERAGLISRRRSAGDGRRRYVQLHPASLPNDWPATRRAPRRVLFVCTHNSARSPLAAALWQRKTGRPALSAGTDPATHVNPGAIAAARRSGVDLGDVAPQHIDRVADTVDLVVTVCDQAHEELEPGPEWLHWSVPDPVSTGSAAAFDAARDDLQRRIESLAHSTNADPGGAG